MIDLYSDTQTRPTPGMRDAMARAEVGDEQSDSDPDDPRLCERVATLLGMEAGVFMPSGTMCNLVSILVQTRPGDEIVVDDQSHIYNTEAAGSAAIGGVSVKGLGDPGRSLYARGVRGGDPPTRPHGAALGPGLGGADHELFRAARSGRSPTCAASATSPITRA